MPPDFKRLIGGVKGPEFHRRDPAFPRAALSAAGHFSGTVRSFYCTLSTPQYQSHAGSCGPHDASFVMESEARARVGVTFQACRMDVYRGARWLRGEEHVDGGVVMSDLFQWIREYGVVNEVRKAYNADEVTTWAPPVDGDWIAERALLTADFQPIEIDPDPILAELEKDRCVSFAHSVYSQMTDQAAITGIETGPDGGGSLGGHARAFCGFDLDKSFGQFGTGGLLIHNWWNNWGLPHPKASTDRRYAAHIDSCSWLPLSVLRAANFIYDMARIARGLALEA